MTERDTHFINAATLAANEIREKHGDIPPSAHEAIVSVFARYIYDLFVHDRMNTPSVFLEHAASKLEAEEMVNGISDLI